MNDPMIAIEDLHKRFLTGSPLRGLLGRRRDAVPVLRGVDLRVEPGEILALVGGNGAGKSTVIKSVAALLMPDAGHVHVLGHDVRRGGRELRGQVGYVLADERSFHWRLSAGENLEFFANLQGMRGAAARDRITSLLHDLDLLDAGTRPFGQFSTGMRQRMAIARALLPRPRVLLMDEPTRGVDAAHAADVWRLVRTEIESVEGCVMLVTHQFEEALAQSARIAVLANGRIALDSRTDRLGSLAEDLDGFTLSVRGLAPCDLAALARFPGVRDIRVASQLAGEQTLEVWTHGSDLPLAGFLGQLTLSGATICSLQRSPPLHGILERLTAATATCGGREAVTA